MKIFFICSLSGKKKYLKNYQEIINYLSNEGHEVIADHVFKRDVKDIVRFDIKKHTREFKRLISEMRKCDAVVAEISFSSTTVGSFVALALQNFTPTLLLYQNSYHGLVVGDPNRLIKMSSYNLNNLDTILRKFLLFVNERKLSIRFNLMLDKNIDKFLAQKALETNISKAEYVRS